MGVDFYSCDVCEEIYDDCGGYYDHCESCGKMICFDCQVELNMRDEPEHGAALQGNYWDGSTLKQCPYCMNEIIDDDTVLDYLIKKYGLTKDQIIEEIKQNT